MNLILYKFEASSVLVNSIKIPILAKMLLVHGVVGVHHIYALHRFMLG